MAKRTPRGRPRRISPQHYAVQFDTDQFARPITMDARSLTLPSFAIISVVVASMSLTYFLAQERSRLDTRIDTVVTSVENLATSISQLAEGLKFGNTDRFTMTHYALFCAKFQSANPGLICPSIGADMTSDATDILRSTLSTVDERAKAAREKAASARREERANPR